MAALAKAAQSEAWRIWTTRRNLSGAIECYRVIRWTLRVQQPIEQNATVMFVIFSWIKWCPPVRIHPVSTQIIQPIPSQNIQPPASQNIQPPASQNIQPPTSPNLPISTSQTKPLGCVHVQLRLWRKRLHFTGNQQITKNKQTKKQNQKNQTKKKQKLHKNNKNTINKTNNNKQRTVWNSERLCASP